MWAAPPSGSLTVFANHQSFLTSGSVIVKDLLGIFVAFLLGPRTMAHPRGRTWRATIFLRVLYRWRSISTWCTKNTEKVQAAAQTGQARRRRASDKVPKAMLVSSSP